MHVGLYIPSMHPSAGGGYRFAAEIVDALESYESPNRHQFTVLTRSPDGATTSRSTLPRVLVPSVTMERARVRMSRLWRRLGRRCLQRDVREDHLTRLVKSVGIDFMVYPSAHHPLTLEIPYAVVVWDLQHRLQPFFPEVSADGIWQAREENFSLILRRAAYVVTGTEAGRREVQHFFGVAAERLRILPHPTPHLALAPPPPDDTLTTRYALPTDYLFYPAQFWAHKNHATILHALRCLRDEQGLQQHVVFSGSDQGNENHVRRLAEDLGLAEQVRFLGFIPFEDVVQLHRRASALCYMSFFGPENLPPLEAFALGCPVIAANVSGAEEQLGDAALLVNPRDPRQLAGAILRLRDDPQLRQQLIAKGQHRAKRFVAADFVNGLLDICDEFEAYRCTWRAA